MKKSFPALTFWTGIVLIGLSYWSVQYALPLNKTGWLLLTIGFTTALVKSILKVVKDQKDNKNKI